MDTEYVWSSDATTQNISKQAPKTVTATDQHGDNISLYKVTQTDGHLRSEDFYLASEVALSRQEATNEHGAPIEQVQVELKHVFGQKIRPAPMGSNQPYSVTNSSSGDLGSAIKHQNAWTAPCLKNGKMTVSVGEQTLTL